MFHIFFFLIPLQGQGIYPSFHFLLILLNGKPGQQIPQFCKFLFFFFIIIIIIMSGRLTKIRWSVCMSKSHRRFCISFSRTDAGLFIYHLFVCSNLNFLHNSQWITMPTQWCLVLYSFYANLLHLLIIRLIVSSLSPHNLHLLFYSVLSILALIWLVLMVFFVLLLWEIQFHS